MPVTPAEELEFDEDDLSPIVQRMQRLAAADAGWINLVPEVEAQAEGPPGGGLFSSLFSARGPSVPLGTWSAATSSKRGSGRSSVGVQHGSGPRALARLGEVGLPLPAGWIKVMDHPRRGLVATVPAGTDHDDVVYWLLSAMHVVSTVPLTGRWLARVFGVRPGP